VSARLQKTGDRRRVGNEKSLRKIGRLAIGTTKRMMVGERRGRENMRRMQEGRRSTTEGMMITIPTDTGPREIIGTGIMVVRGTEIMARRRIGSMGIDHRSTIEIMRERTGGEAIEGARDTRTGTMCARASPTRRRGRRVVRSTKRRPGSGTEHWKIEDTMKEVKRERDTMLLCRKEIRPGRLQRL